jgi:FtsZ-binding cell division protein ZapB
VKQKLMDYNRNRLTDVSNVVVRDLREYGVEQAGTYKGSLEAYKGMMDKIRSGSILTEADRVNLVPKSEEIKIRIDKQIDTLKEKNYELKNRVDEIRNTNDISKGLIPLRELEIADLNNQMDDIEGLQQGHRYNTFSWGTYSFLLVLLIGLSFYLLYFYMSVADFALNGVNTQKLFQEGRLNIQLLPSLKRLIYLIINYPPLIVFPTIFFGLGTSIHLFYERGKNFRPIVIGLLVLVFIGDVLLAFQVHSEINQILIKANREEFKSLIVSVWADSRFYLVLFLGFGVFAIWSAVYFLLQSEWSKRNQMRMRGKRILRLQTEIRELEEKRHVQETELTNNLKRMDDLNKEKERMVLPVDTIEKNINFFREGWNGYISTLYGRDKAEEQIAQVNDITDGYVTELKAFQDSMFR